MQNTQSEEAALYRRLAEAIVKFQAAKRHKQIIAAKHYALAIALCCVPLIDSFNSGILLLGFLMFPALIIWQTTRALWEVHTQQKEMYSSLEELFRRMESRHS